MNILCLDQFGELGGAQRCLLELLPALAERGWSMHLAAPGDGELAGCAARRGATFDALRCGPYAAGRKTLGDMARFAAEAPVLAGEIRRLARRYAADLIYVNGPRLLPAAALAARQGAPVLFHAHSVAGGMGRWLAGRSLAHARAAMVACCRFVAAAWLPYADHRGVRVVYNGVRRMGPARREAGAEMRIGMIGRMAPEKGQVDFLRAARRLHAGMPQCRFVVCGAPLFSDAAGRRYCRELDALAEGLPVEFAGWREDVEQVLGTLDLLVAPSAASDATPRAILEAFAAGVPVIAYASGGIPELIAHGVTGYLVEERTDKALARAIESALREPERLREMAGAAHARALGEFSLERYREQMAQAMEAAAGGAGRR